MKLQAIKVRRCFHLNDPSQETKLSFFYVQVTVLYLEMDSPNFLVSKILFCGIYPSQYVLIQMLSLKLYLLWRI